MTAGNFHKPRKKPKRHAPAQSDVLEEDDKAQKGLPSPPSFLSPSSMASLTSSCCYCSYASQLLPRLNSPLSPFPSPTFFSPFTVSTNRTTLLLTAAKKKDSDSVPKESSNSKGNADVDEEEFVEVEEELPWYQEKALDVVEFTGSVTQALPGPRVGRSSLPWILAVPLAYLGVTFVIAFVKTVRNFNSPKEKRRRQVFLLLLALVLSLCNLIFL